MADTLLVFGDAVAEITLQVAELPIRGGDASAQDPRLTMGGSAANCAVAASRAGATVRMLGNIGSDSFADLIVAGLGEADTSGLHRIDGPSPLVVVLVDPAGEKTMISARGPAELAIPIGDTTGTAHLHLTGYSFQAPGSRRTAMQLLELAAESRWTTSLDPSAQFAASNPEPGLLGRFTFLFPNAAEAGALTGETDPFTAGRRLRETSGATVVVTDGANGCLLFGPDLTHHFPAPPVEDVVDTTGAGDALAGATLAALLGGSGLAEAIELGLSAAAVAVGRRGGH